MLVLKVVECSGCYTSSDGLSPEVKQSTRPASRSASARGSGMARSVTPGDGRSPPSRISTPSALRSGSGSASIGTAVAASLATPSQSAQTINSSPPKSSPPKSSPAQSSASRSRGRPPGSKNKANSQIDAS